MLRVLTYHRVAHPQDYPRLNPRLISALPEAFSQQMAYLARNFDVVSLEDVIENAHGRRRLPRKAVLVTFDDAYRDFADVAWPEMKLRHLPAALFVATDYPDNGHRHFWWDELYRAFTAAQVRFLEHEVVGRLRLGTPEERLSALNRTIDAMKGLPHSEMLRSVEDTCRRLGSEQIADNGVLGWNALDRLSREGLHLGAHTRTHPVLTQLTAEAVREEVAGSITELRKRIGRSLPVFAYPGGFHNETVESVLKEEGISVAFTTQDGFNPVPFHDPLRLRRTNITPRTSSWVFRLRLTRLGALLDRLRH